ncbi:6-phosphogluconolactonase [Henriciella sp. AS95]|uniref:6-phosphogluconolactonase n=1 Tax=Henriciella sp. AS95 TaxID=3135782 RepID=UPI00317F9CC9
MTTGTQFHTFSDRETFEADAAHWIKKRLENALGRRGKATLFCSGGSTPGPIYQSLSGAELDWENVTVGLADERWVPESHEASNAALIRQTLLRDKAEAATFLPMKTDGESAFGSEAELDKSYSDAADVIDVLILGMGPDGHTLSWFADAKGLGAATDPGGLLSVAPIDAPKSDVTGDITERMTLTYPAVARARHILLLMTGDEKRSIYEHGEPDLPINLLRKAAGDALTVFYRS